MNEQPFASLEACFGDLPLSGLVFESHRMRAVPMTELIGLLDAEQDVEAALVLDGLDQIRRRADA